MSEKHGNPMIRCPAELHPLVKEFARLYRSGNQQGVLEALHHALATLSTGAVSTGAVTPVSSQDVSNVLVDVMDRLERIEKAVFPQVPTSVYSDVDISLHTGDSTESKSSTPSSDNGLVHTGDSGNADRLPYTPDSNSRTNSLVIAEVVAAHIQALLTNVVSPLQAQVGELSQTLSSHLATQTLALKEELNEAVERIEQRQGITADPNPEPELPDALEATVVQEEVIPPSIQAESIAVDPPAPDPVAAQETTEDQVSAMLAEGLVALQVDLLKPAPKSEAQSAAVTDDGWLTAREAHAIVVERSGYSSGLDYFRQLTPAQLQSLGFETDPSRKRKGSRNSRWLRLLPDA